METAGLLLFAVVGWCCLGAIGIAISLTRGRRSEAFKHARSLIVVLGFYFVVLLTVSVVQPQRTVGMGRDQCFGKMCFAVIGAAEVPSFAAESEDASRVIRVEVRVSNRAHSTDSDSLIRVCLVDSRGRTLQPIPGLSGNRITAEVTGNSQMLSQPMFRIAKDSASLGLVFSHGNWQRGRLTIGDSDSLGHKPNIVPLKITKLER